MLPLYHILVLLFVTLYSCLPVGSYINLANFRNFYFDQGRGVDKYSQLDVKNPYIIPFKFFPKQFKQSVKVTLQLKYCFPQNMLAPVSTKLFQSLMNTGFSKTTRLLNLLLDICLVLNDLKKRCHS